MPVDFGNALRPPLAIALGAIGGALCRYYLSQGMARWLGTGALLPYGTLLANLSGCLALGWLTARLQRGTPLAAEIALLAGTGFLGSYTTFSTYALESWRLLSAGRLGAAAVYGLGSPLLGLLCVGLGAALAGRSSSPGG